MDVPITSTGQRDAKVISLITTAHFFSHLYIMALPPLFPILTVAFGVGAAELGVAIAVMNLATAILQAPTGFLVDRFGPARALIIGHILFALAIGSIGIWPHYGALLACMLLAGIGNSVYHPADYSVLSGGISQSRIGRAFAVHTFGGHLGFAAAPIFMVALTELAGWRAAFAIVGGVGCAFGLFLLFQSHLLKLPHRQKNKHQQESSRTGIDVLLSLPVLLALLFFILIAVTLTGISSFSPLVLNRVAGLHLIEANLPLTVFLLASATGVISGGLFADKTDRHTEIVVCCCLVAAISVLLALLFALHNIAMLSVLFALAGFAGGALSPSRDLLVRRLAGPEHSGKVFGFVTTGFNLGGLIAPPIYGLIIDFGVPIAVFWLVVLFNLLTVVVVLVGERIRPPQAG